MRIKSTQLECIQQYMVYSQNHYVHLLSLLSGHTCFTMMGWEIGWSYGVSTWLCKPLSQSLSISISSFIFSPLGL